MNKQIAENQVMKLYSKCGILKVKISFYFRNNNQKYRSEGVQWCSINQKE